MCIKHFNFLSPTLGDSCDKNPKAHLREFSKRVFRKNMSFSTRIRPKRAFNESNEQESNKQERKEETILCFYIADLEKKLYQLKFNH